MSNVLENVEYSDESIKEADEAIEEAIAKNNIKYYRFKNFTNIQEIDSRGFRKVYRVNRKNSHRYFTLKSLINLGHFSVAEIINELKHQRQVGLHENIIHFYGITAEYQQDNSKQYFLVLEHADSGTLRNYLNKNKNLTWKDRFNLAIQLTYAISCLHNEGIAHRDLHSGNVLVHQNKIKLADFGLSKRIEESYNFQSRLYGMIPYVDPKIFCKQENDEGYLLDERSDIYSIGVLLWEISSGLPPFHNESYDVGLAMEISQGLREKPVFNTPSDYIKIYTDCWNSIPIKRPTANLVVAKLKEVATKDYNINKNDRMSSVQKRGLSSNVADFHDFLSENNNVNEMVYEIVNALKKLNDEEKSKPEILNYLSNIASKEIFNWLLNNQNDLNSIFLLGKFYSLGIGTDIDKQSAIELYKKAANLGSCLAQYNLGSYYKSKEDYNEAFELFKKSSDGGYAEGMSQLGHFYCNGMGTDIDRKRAFKLFQKSANLGSISGINNLGNCYQNGFGAIVDKQKAFELYQKAADLGSKFGINNLGFCYQHGIGTDIDERKAFELYHSSANLGNVFGISNLGYCYQYGIGTDIDKEKALEFYQKAVDLGNMEARQYLAFMHDENDKEPEELSKETKSNLDNLQSYDGTADKYKSDDPDSIPEINLGHKQKTLDFFPKDPNFENSPTQLSHTSEIENENENSRRSNSNYSIHNAPKKVLQSSLNICNKFIHKLERRIHAANTTVEKLHNCDFPGCDKSFSRLDLLNRHKSTHTLWI